MMESDAAGVPRGMSAPYGHACSNCAKAKCKCMSRGPGLGCERCTRLQRECKPSLIVRKRLQPATARNKTAQLEEKLNDIVSLLKSQNGSIPTRSSSGIDSTVTSSPDHVSLGFSVAQPSIAVPTPGSSSPSSAVPSDTPCLGYLEADRCLNTFRSLHLKQFPFVHIPLEMSASKLQKERPFLWLNISFITCKKVAEKKRIDKCIRETLAQKLIVDLERNLDLLLGLVAYLTWYMSIDGGKKLLCMYMGLATSLIVDLCLDRSAGESICRETNSKNAYQGYWRNQLQTFERTNEERRAVLACYATCTSLSSFLRSPMMRWTPHMEDCLNHLTQSPEVAGDESLAVCVRMSRLAEEVTVATNWRLGEPEILDAPREPPMLLIKALQKRIAGIYESMPVHVKEQKIIKAQFHFTELIINDLPLYTTNYPSQVVGQKSLSRTLCADACIGAARACLDAWLSLVPQEFYSTTMLAHLQFARCTHTLYRLSITEDPDWDRETVRNSFNLMGFLEKAAMSITAVPGAPGLEDLDDPLYKRIASTMRATIPIWSKVFSETPVGTSETAAPMQDEAVTGTRGSIDFAMMDFSEDWMTVMLREGTMSSGTAVVDASQKADDSDGLTSGPKDKQLSISRDIVDLQEETYMHGFALVAVLSGLSLVFFLAMLDISVVGTAIPKITSDFHRLEDVGWYVGAYQLSSAAVQPLTGKLFAHFNTKRTLIIFFLLFELGSVICGAAVSSIMFILGRVVAGLGASGLANGCITIIAAATAPDKRPFYTSLTMGSFYINLPVGGLAGILLVLTSIPEPSGKPSLSIWHFQHFINVLDVQGFLLLSPTAVMFLMALQFGSAEYGWASSIVIGLFCGSAALFALFLVWEYKRGTEAMIPWPMVRKQVVWTSCLNYGFLMTGTVTAGIYTPLFFQSVIGLSPTMSAVYLLPAVFSQLAGVILSGALVVRLRYYVPWAAGGAAITAIASGVISTWNPRSSRAELLCYQLLYFGRGAAMQMGIIALQNSLSPLEFPVGSALTIFCQNMFSAVFVIVASTIFQETLTHEIATNVSGITPQQAIAAGGSAEAVRRLGAGNEKTLNGLLHAYKLGFSNVFYLLAALSIAGFITAFGMGWVDIKKKNETCKDSSNA
ncbi:MFS-type transporter calB [Paramyrothecium foliicola]|nr:MFS-type transporter calB [Paramyrothecium foliicola]